MDGARPEERVAEARARYLAKNGLREEDYALPHFAVRVGRFTVRLPNPRARREVVALHDVATGFPTTSTRTTGPGRLRPGSRTSWRGGRTRPRGRW